MSDEHLKEHENNPMLTCHQFRYKDHKRNKPEEITRTKLYVLLFMALNHVESEIHLGDLIRFLREGHVTLQIASTVSNDARYNLDFNNRLQIGCTDVPKHHSLVSTACEMAKHIGFQFKETDLRMLCKRYLQELCLPPEFGSLIDVILDACPPTMRNGKRQSNYEARAMAYILFALKLLFGLDDNREYLISSSGREINKKISALNSENSEGSVQQRPLFVWCEWVEYIEMRNIILLQLHCPTAMKYHSHGEGMTTMYLEYLKKTDEKNAEVKSTFKSYAKLMQRVRDQFQATYNIDPKLNQKLTFYPSLTPNRSYMDEVRFSGQTDVFVPTFMDETHDDRDIEPFLRPAKLQSFFRQHRLKLSVNKLKCDAVIDGLCTSQFFDSDRSTRNYCVYDFDVTTQEWLDELKSRRTSETKRSPNDKGKKAVEVRLNAIGEYYRVAKETKRKECASDTSADIFDCVSSDDEDDAGDVESEEEAIEFTVSNFDYWLILSSIQNASHELCKTLPKTFQWLLKQGADLIECKESNLFCELISIECYLSRDVKPSSKAFDTVINPNVASCKSAICNNY